ncbi:hypothetical protein QBC40DRAFT_348557 [Triangularia verruculosa]|uniref:Uncharacterized protein n=1 Tax=Triangularia verruculosa TaxID=2587418 RepID=A0AAN6XGZ0_9PEZI|nr:hypothetical protein QBC40DRAFT_348557 [Triangularia verruculosa]
MAAPTSAQGRVPPKMPSLEALEKGLNEVLVLTGKAFKAAGKDIKGPPQEVAATIKGNAQEAAAAINAQVPVVIGSFNRTLDDVEWEIQHLKSIYERDLNQLKANRKPPPPPKQKPVAPPAASVPPAPMESPTMAKKGQVFKGNIPGSSRPAPSPVAVPVHPIKQENKPVAPIPNMGGIDLSSPELKHSPSPKTIPRSKPVKNSPQLASVAAAAAAGRPASAPPKKETKVLPPQIPRPGTAAPQFPSGPPAMQAKAASVPARNMSASPAMTNSMPATGSAPQPPGLPQANNENFFTEMTFTVAPSTEQRGQQQQQQHPQPQQVDLMKVEGSANFGVGVGSSTMDVDNEIDNLFEDMGMNMDYNIEGGASAADDSNFNEMYFDLEANSGAASSGNNNNGNNNNLGMDDFTFT